MSKVIGIRCTSPYLVRDQTIIKSLIFVDTGKGERSIEKLKAAINKLYGEKLFIDGKYAITEITTLWDDGATE